MRMTECVNWIDKTGLELVEHGDLSFPVACYHDDLMRNPVEWHWHEEMELILVAEGNMIIAMDGNRFIVKQGNGFFINSGVLHSCWNYGEYNCRFRSIVFHPRLVGGDKESIFWKKYVRHVIDNKDFQGFLLKGEIEWQEEILKATESAWESCEKENYGYEFAVRNELSKVLISLFEHVTESNTRSDKREKDNLRMKWMLEYISENYSESISMMEIAASANISESECLRCFRNTIDTTPIQYLKAYRIKRAAEYLSNTNMRIVDIGVACGFQDMSYFAKTFKNIYGLTPSEYRKTSAIL